MSAEAAFTACRGAWKSMVELGIKSKKDFQADADECMRFFNGPYDFMYGPDLSSNPSRGELFAGKRQIGRPSVCVTLNKVAEGVQLFGPTLYHRNPNCKVNPRKQPELPPELFGDPNDPRMQQVMGPIFQQMSAQQQRDNVRAILMESLLSYLPVAGDLKTNSRDAIDETIIKGLGILWARMKKLGNGRMLPILEYDTQDNLLIDPDAERDGDAKVILRRFVEPVWEVEASRGLEPGTLKANYESYKQYAAVEAAGDNFKRKQGKTNDLLVYWGVWSKMGIGGLLKGISPDAAEIDRYGQNVYVEVCDSYNYFLNVPPEIWEDDEEVRKRLQWETPFYYDVPGSNGWPYTDFRFHKVPRQVWPMSHFKPVLGQLKFLNWGMSWLATGMQKRSRDFMVVPKTIDAEIEDTILNGPDLSLIKLSNSLSIPINQLVSFIEHPGFPEWQFKVLQKIETDFEKGSGLSELMYGMQQTQDRSATETATKENFVNVRPDEMANKVEESMTDAFRKLAFMARWHLKGDDIAQIFGPVVGKLWTQFVETANVDEIINSLEYRIEAGSTKKPNVRKDQQDANQSLQIMGPMLSDLAMNTGQVAPYNALMKFWGKAFSVDVAEFLLPVPPPPPPAPPPGAETAQELQQNEAEHKQSIRHSDELHKLKLAHEKEKTAQMKKKATSNGKA